MAHDAHTSDFDRDFNAFWQRLGDYTQRAADVPAGAAGSAEWFEKLGQEWQEARERQGLSRQQVASRMGMEVDQVRFVELGLSNHEELKSGLLEQYAGVLGDPDIYQTYLQSMPKLDE